jgi:6-phosphogluconate dehydrogenase
MQLGMIGLGRMGANMVRRLLRDGHECVVFDAVPEAVESLVRERAIGAASIEDLIAKLRPPRFLWLMVPAAAVDQTIEQVRTRLAAGDTVIDGGNSYYVDDIRRSKMLAADGVRYIDVGTSGGVWGLERGYCMMIGGDRDSVRQLDPIFKTLSPGPGSIARTPDFNRLGDSTAEHGYLHCGPSGAGHGIMAAYAEGLDVLRAADAGTQRRAVDAETTPLRDPEHYQYQIALPQVAEVWRRGSVIASWLLDLTAAALVSDPELKRFAGRVSDSGEGRWTIKAAVDTGVPTPVLTASLYERFSSRGNAEVQGKLLSAMRLGFGGHLEKPAEQGGRFGE